MNKKQIIPSVNFHLWEPCNMKCGFCFATFQDVKQTVLPKGHLPKNEAIKIVQQLADFGFQKITFVGGEPTLCPWLTDLIKQAKEKGMTTMIVTNGSKLTNEFLEENKKNLDWIAISIDSINEITNSSIGRAISGNKVLTKKYYNSVINRIKKYNYRLKINTVVNKYNFKENMVELISEANPERWKVFQVLPIENQNDKNIDDFIISENEFDNFLINHKEAESMVSENNNEMKGSYAMVDPAGRFFDNTKGFHNYSKSIIEVGTDLAIKEMNYDFSKFIKRNGFYNWK
jgi:radical S-adenosyl methionine domain-containing protein 2